VGKIEEQVKVLQQTLLEVAHAQQCGSSWYTKGEAGLYDQVSMWVRRGQTAINEIKKQEGRCDECGANIVDNCHRCGAPQCCPQCCKIEQLEADLTSYRDRLALCTGFRQADKDEIEQLQSRIKHHCEDLAKAIPMLTGAGLSGLGAAFQDAINRLSPGYKP
jgi:hypothetical protein